MKLVPNAVKVGAIIMGIISLYILTAIATASRVAITRMEVRLDNLLDKWNERLASILYP